jgi:hypothetical protein
MYADLADVDYLTRHDGSKWVPGVPVRMASAVWTTQVTTTTTEIIVTGSSVTWTAVAGRRYRITVSTMYSSTAGGDNVQTRLRYAPGASVTTAGTLTREVIVSAPANNAVTPLTYVHELTGVVAGQTTIALFVVRYTGGVGTVAVGNVVSSTNSLLVEDIGV